jgi:hypothetical protein
MRGNLNDHVWVKLTPKGKEMYEEWLKNYRTRCGRPTYVGPHRVDQFAEINGFMCFRLEVFMYVFGPMIGTIGPLGGRLIEDDQIYYTRPF